MTVKPSDERVITIPITAAFVLVFKSPEIKSPAVKIPVIEVGITTEPIPCVCEDAPLTVPKVSDKKCKCVDDVVKAHQDNAAYYDKELSNIPGLKLLTRHNDRTSSFWI